MKDCLPEYSEVYRVECLSVGYKSCIQFSTTSAIHIVSFSIIAQRVKIGSIVGSPVLKPALSVEEQRCLVDIDEKILLRMGSRGISL